MSVCCGEACGQPRRALSAFLGGETLYAADAVRVASFSRLTPGRAANEVRAGSTDRMAILLTAKGGEKSVAQGLSALAEAAPSVRAGLRKSLRGGKRLVAAKD